MDPLKRIDLRASLDEVMQKTTEAFSLGDVLTFSIIPTGYQECNIDLRTKKGRYVIKVFSQEKTRQRIDDVIWGYAHLHTRGTPLPTLEKTRDGHYVLEIPGILHPSFLCAFTYFEGKSLTQTPITDDDIAAITKSMGVIHTTPKVIGRYYDTMGIINVPAEYERNSDMLFADEKAWLKPVVAKLLRLDVSSFHQSIIHGSVEKENIIKNTEGNLCLLDLGCMDYNASVLDIGTYIANFTVHLTSDKRDHIIKLILDTYQKVLPLTPGELAALLTLIRAQYAAYVIRMTYYLRKGHDMTKQTQIWLDRGWDGLKTYQNTKSIV